MGSFVSVPILKQMNNWWWKYPTHHRTKNKEQGLGVPFTSWKFDTSISNFTTCIFFWEVFIEDRIINLHIALWYLSNHPSFSILQICMVDLVLKLSLEDSKESQTTHILLYKLDLWSDWSKVDSFSLESDQNLLTLMLTQKVSPFISTT